MNQSYRWNASRRCSVSCAMSCAYPCLVAITLSSPWNSLEYCCCYAQSSSLSWLNLRVSILCVSWMVFVTQAQMRELLKLWLFFALWYLLRLWPRSSSWLAVFALISVALGWRYARCLSGLMKLSSSLWLSCQLWTTSKNRTLQLLMATVQWASIESQFSSSEDVARL